MTDRYTADNITDDALDELYAERDALRTDLIRISEAESADAATGSYAQRAERAEDAVARVRALHQAVGYLGHQICAACDMAGAVGGPLHLHPCPTITALDEEPTA